MRNNLSSIKYVGSGKKKEKEKEKSLKVVSHTTVADVKTQLRCGIYC